MKRPFEIGERVAQVASFVLLTSLGLAAALPSTSLEEESGELRSVGVKAIRTPASVPGPGDDAPSLRVSTWLVGEAPPAGDLTLVLQWDPLNPKFGLLERIADSMGEFGGTIVVLAGEGQQRTFEMAQRSAESLSDHRVVRWTSFAWDDGARSRRALFGEPAPRDQAMLIDARGVVAWVGSLELMLEPIPDVADGSWNVIAGADRMREYGRRLAGALDTQELAERLGVLDGLAADYPRLARTSRFRRYLLAFSLGKETRVRAMGDRIIETAVAEKNVPELHLFARHLIGPHMGHDVRYLDLAERAVLEARALQKEPDTNSLSLDARVHAWRGDFPRAIELQERALARATPMQRKKQEELLAEYLEATQARGD